MSARRHISWKTKYACALLALRDVPYEHAKEMTEDQIISLYQVDHNILHAINPINLFWNLTPKLIAPHRRKSAKDKGVVAKAVRIDHAQEDFRRRALERPCGQKRERTGNWPKGRKIRSQGFRRR